MSADNWALCPKCVVQADREYTILVQNLAEAYGVRSEAEYLGLAEAVAKGSRSRRMDNNFREDYEIYGAEDGVVKVNYHGQCTECGVELRFETQHPIDLTDHGNVW